MVCCLGNMAGLRYKDVMPGKTGEMMYTQCEKCKAIIPRMAVRCTTCGRSRMKEVFDSELLSKKMQIEDKLRRRMERYQESLSVSRTGLSMLGGDKGKK